jgi:hypothetical protein
MIIPNLVVERTRRQNSAGHLSVNRGRRDKNQIVNVNVNVNKREKLKVQVERPQELDIYTRFADARNRRGLIGGRPWADWSGVFGR